MPLASAEVRAAVAPGRHYRRMLGHDPLGRGVRHALGEGDAGPAAGSRRRDHQRLGLEEVEQEPVHHDAVLCCDPERDGSRMRFGYGARVRFVRRIRGQQHEHDRQRHYLRFLHHPRRHVHRRLAQMGEQVAARSDDGRCLVRHVPRRRRQVPHVPAGPLGDHLVPHPCGHRHTARHRLPHGQPLELLPQRVPRHLHRRRHGAHGLARVDEHRRVGRHLALRQRHEGGARRPKQPPLPGDQVRRERPDALN
mmetsp:Transcript_4844/g.13776  ORF Transcript_4844/g.13776 Transcript_4844/m.13776 type:complete len:251 (+) Transcript_4844:69-821(+)